MPGEAYPAVGQYERLSLLQDLLLFQRSVGFANASMADIVAEQSDLLQLTEASPVEDLEPALPQFRNMLNCLNEVSPLLDMVAARLDVGTPLAFAQTDFEDAIAAIEAGDKFDVMHRMWQPSTGGGADTGSGYSDANRLW